MSGLHPRAGAGGPHAITHAESSDGDGITRAESGFDGIGHASAERASLIREHKPAADVRFVPHALWFNGVPSYFEVLGATEPFDVDEVVELAIADGRSFRCVVLDRTPGCTVIATL